MERRVSDTHFSEFWSSPMEEPVEPMFVEQSDLPPLLLSVRSQVRFGDF
jgi:hypothetical protein